MTHDPLCLCGMDPKGCHCACLILERVRPLIERETVDGMIAHIERAIEAHLKNNETSVSP